MKSTTGNSAGISPAAALTGLFSSFLSGFLVIAFFLAFLRRHTLYPFVGYRLILALLVAGLLVF